MISAELRHLMATARPMLLQDSEWSMVNSIPEGASGRSPPTIGPADYSEFLQVANGAIFGRIVVFDAKIIEKMQFYADPVDGAPVRLNREEWFSFGKVNEDPLFIRRSDNTIWGFPDVGVIWWQSGRFERVAEGLDAFLLRYAFGSEYLSLASADDTDQWWRLLQRLGRTA